MLRPESPRNHHTAQQPAVDVQQDPKHFSNSPSSHVSVFDAHAFHRLTARSRRTNECNGGTGDVHTTINRIHIYIFLLPLGSTS